MNNNNNNNRDKSYQSRALCVVLPICSLLLLLVVVGAKCESPNGIESADSETAALRLALSDVDFDQVDLLTRCVQMRSMESENMHTSIGDQELLEGLVRAARIELETLYNESPSNAPGEFVFVHAIRHKFIKSCKKFQESTKKELEQIRNDEKRVLSKSVKSWLAADNICTKLIGKSKSLINKSFAIYQKEIEQDFMFQKNPTWFANRIPLVLLSTPAIDSEELVPKLVNRFRLVTKDDSEQLATLCKRIASHVLIESFARFFRFDLNLSTNSREEFNKTFQTKLVRPCKYAHKVLINWAKEYQMHDWLTLDDQEWLEADFICQIVLIEAYSLENPAADSSLQDDVFKRYKDLA